jgi:hypothetical protein
MNTSMKTGYVVRFHVIAVKRVMSLILVIFFTRYFLQGVLNTDYRVLK